MRATVFDIERFAVHDGEGIRTTVFFKGCPLNCAWCHNPESIKGGKDIWVRQEQCIHCGRCTDCPENAITIDDTGRVDIDKQICTFCNFCVDICPVNCIARIDRDMSVDEIVDAVKKDVVYYRTSGGGVTLSGGEPFQQKKAAVELLKKLKANEISTCVETCLYCGFDALEQAAPYVDQFFVDLKLIDNDEHIKYIGKPNGLIQENFKKLAGIHNRIIVRVPMVPGITDTRDNIEGITKRVLGVNPKIPIELLNYNSLGNAKYERLGRVCACSDLKPLSDSEFMRRKKLVSDLGGVSV